MEDSEPPSNQSKKTGANETLLLEEELHFCPFFYSSYCEGENPQNQRYKDSTCFSNPDKHFSCNKLVEVMKDYIIHPGLYLGVSEKDIEHYIENKLPSRPKLSIETQIEEKQEEIKSLENSMVSVA
jgi:hypothetical protein